MKHFLFKFILVVLGLVISANLRADENKVLIDGIYYNLTTETKTATVTKENDFSYSGEVVIPPSVTYGGVTYTVTTIGSHAFDWCSNVESVIIPNTVTEIENSAFYYCYYKLKSISIPNSVKSIGAYAFQYCSALSSVTLGNGLTDIGPNAFEYSGLISIDIPEGVKSIGDAAFGSCGLKSITIPASVTSIGSQAFRYCKSLESIVSYMQNPPRIDSYTFYYSFSNSNVGCQLTIPHGTKDAYIANGWTESEFKGGIVEAPYKPASDNYLAITDAEVCKGRQITLPVDMKNTEDITALQFEVSLPEGVAISKCQLTERRGKDHTVSYKKLPNGNYQVTAISLSKANFDGTAGALLNLRLDVDEGVTADDYTISLTNIELTTANTQAVNPADVSATLTVSDVKIADADGNGKVSITDAVAIVSYILGDGMDGFVAAAADVDGNGKITITDAVAVVDMILSGSASAKMRVEMDEEMLDPQ